MASAKGLDDKDVDDDDSLHIRRRSQPSSLPHARGLLPFAPGQPRTYTLASSLALARLSSPAASSSAPCKHLSSAVADEPGPGPGRGGYREAMDTSPPDSLSPLASPHNHTHTHYMLPIENKSYSYSPGSSPSGSPEAVERKLRQDLDREFKYFRGASNNIITNNSINSLASINGANSDSSSSGRGYGLSSVPSTSSGHGSGHGPGLFLDFNASVTRDGYVPAIGRDPSPVGIAASVMFGGNDGDGGGDRYKHR